VAKQANLSEETINNIVGFYWREVRKNLSSLKHSRVHITNLGDFVTKHWKIDSKIEMLEKFEENNRQKGLQQMTARFKTAETLFDLKILKDIITEEKQRADFIKMHKSHESKRKHNKNMEE
jgi:hypothetical protein